MSGLTFSPLPVLEHARRVGWSVDDNVRRLLRFHWCEKRLMEIAQARLPGTPEWELKCALALHQWQDAEHAHALRTRITEMRSPAPRMDVPPDDALELFFAELSCARDSAELCTGLALAHERLGAAYHEHLAGSNTLVDHPTQRVLRGIVSEEVAAGEWYPATSEAWREHLEVVLAHAGGIAGDRAVSPASVETRSSHTPFTPDLTPRRDERFTGTHEFEFPPQAVYNMEGVPADERNLALLCRRALEMDVPEMMASFLAERRAQPWEFYRDYARQLWDEARHAMMGTVGLDARGVDWTRLPLNVGFSLRLNRHATPIERQILLYAIEQSLMPADTGKRSEYETAQAAGDGLSAHFHDYDWADEVLHTQIGRRWLKHEGITREEALRRAAAIHEHTWAALAQYREPGGQDPWRWWRDLVRAVLGRESAAVPPTTDRPDIVASG